MPAFVEYQVRCIQCGHIHDENVEWLLGHRDVVCPSCGGWIHVDLAGVMVDLRTSDGRDEVLDLSRWSPRRDDGVEAS
jgi:hypothetical protein